jgi:predicted ATPase/class 3 adenylate cyclase
MGDGFPSGTVTFLFTDIEGSTRMVQDHPDGWPSIVADHDRLLKEALSAHNGVLIRTEGDAFFVVFVSPEDAAAAVVAAQRAIAAHEWPEGIRMAVRMGLHTGAGTLGGGDYVGLDVHRAARIAGAANGGQIVLSEVTAALVERNLPDECYLRDLGKHRLKDLLEREALQQIVVPGISDDFPELRTLERVRHNLPVMVTTFVGREDEIADALKLLESTRILTLLGPGGTGKSRLSLQVAAEAAHRFEDGVLFVPLASVTDPDLIPSRVLRAMDMAIAHKDMAPRDQLFRVLEDKSLLLVLDNFEQLVEGSEVVAEMARRSPRSSFLVTSRIPLRISGEQQMPIDPLDPATPDSSVEELARVESVHLFVERASAVRPDFALTEENAHHVARLVNRLDGLPLAIELVVPRLKLLPVAQILERLDALELTGGVRDAPERHQSLWNAIAWSEEALTEACRRLMARMSVFAGGGRLEELEKVCRPGEELGEELLQALTELVDSSLVRPGGRPGRFGMLQVIREFSSRRLDDYDERAEMEHRHAVAYTELFEEATPHLMRRERKDWLEALDWDHDNLRSSFDYVVNANEVDLALRLSWASWRFWQMRAHLYEARTRISKALALEGGDPRLRAKAIEARGGVAWWMNETDECIALYQTALEMWRELGDESEIANALYNRALAHAFFENDVPTARAMFHDAEEIFQRLEDPNGLGNVYWGMGNMEMFAGTEQVGILEVLQKSISEYERAGNVFGEGWALYEYAESLRRRGRVEEALEGFDKGLDLLYETGETAAAVMFLAGYAGAAFDSGDEERAKRLIGAAYGLSDATGVIILRADANQLDEGLSFEHLEALEGDEAAPYQEGKQMSMEDAVSLGRNRD